MSKSRLKLALIPASLFLLYGTHHYLSVWDAQTTSRQFRQFTDTMFQKEIISSTLTLHYTLENPENYGIINYPVTYGSTDEISLVSSGSPSIDDYRQILYQIPYDNLSSQNQLTYDILALYLENEKNGETFSLYSEPLGATIGIQAQLPILLSEYTFSSEKDIETYLQLIAQTDSYFSAIAEFEFSKSKAGLFMSDANADAIISQCQSFLSMKPENNFLITLFDEKVDNITSLPEEQRQAYKEQNRSAVEEHILPAYRLLTEQLEKLKGTGVNGNGLCYFPQGKAYYEYLLRSSTGSYLPIAGIEKRIRQQLEKDLSACRSLLLKNPQAGQSNAFDTLITDPQDILSSLQEQITDVFPTAPSVHYDVKYVHEALEDFLSPAFYLTPPIDNLKEHVIYINRASDYSPLELYTTLAHEGYPGHLYQNVVSDQYLSPVRSILGFGGYTEGWATYVEMESYRYAAKQCADESAAEIAELNRLNRSIMLGISSLLDICIHYHGFTREDTAEFLKNMGIASGNSANAIFDAIIESPANYLKYYLGYLTFSDLRDWCQEHYADSFDLKDFHKQVLTIGPCQFPVLEKYLKAYYE